MIQYYHKINSLYKRDHSTNKFNGEFSCPEFEYLFSNEWIGTEKIDGTSCLLHYDGSKVTVGGRTENTRFYPPLLQKLEEYKNSIDWGYFDPEEWVSNEVTLYGEGYGAKIQNGGNYIPDGVDFILFDIKIGPWWMKKDMVCEIGNKLGLKTVPAVFEGKMQDAIDMVKNGFKSTIGTADSEGLILTPKVDLLARSGKRIITKLKTKDFR